MARCHYKYNKTTKSWGYANKKGEPCVASKSSRRRHRKIAKNFGAGGMQGHFGRLRGVRAARMKAMHGKLSHSQLRGVRINKAAGMNRGHTRF